VDGVFQDSIGSATGLRPFQGHDLVIGNQETGDDGMNGRIDEFRLDLAERPAAWIRHAWFTQRPENSGFVRIR
jgi:hypothetical protein